MKNLIFGILVTGTLNTILGKYQDMTCVSNCDTSNPKYFEQPLIQTIFMFVGEALLFLFVRNETNEYQEISNNENQDCEQVKVMSGRYNFWFLLPAIMDLTSATLINIGFLFN